jgi:hypothetical protein
LIHSYWPAKNKDLQFATAAIETIVISSLAVLFGYWFSSDSSVIAAQQITWLVIGPLLSGLRYGFAYALSSAFIIIGLLFVRFHQLPGANDSLLTVCLALLMTAFVAGEFNHYWRRKLKKLEASVRYLDQRLAQADNTSKILEQSHQRLEQSVASQSSLRDCILAMREQISSTDSDNDHLSKLGPIILRFLSDHADIQEASLYAIDNDNCLNPKAICTLGNPVSLDITNPLVTEAIAGRKTVTIKKQIIDEQGYCGSTLLAIPLVDVFGNLWAIINVHKIPFRSYTPENIKMIAVLASYIGDELGQKMLSDFSETEDQYLRRFLVEVQRCIQNKADEALPSAIISIEFKDQNNFDSLKTLFLENNRSLDLSWEGLNQRQNKVLFLLLPFTSNDTVKAYKSSCEYLLKERFSIPNFQAAGIYFHHHDLQAMDKASDVVFGMTTQIKFDHPQQLKSLSSPSLLQNSI